MHSRSNRRFLALLVLALSAIVVAFVLVTSGLTATPAWIGFALAIGIALYIAYQWERNGDAERPNLR